MSDCHESGTPIQARHGRYPVAGHHFAVGRHDTRAPVCGAIVRGRIQAFLAGPGFRWFAERPRAARQPRWDSTAGAEAVPVAVLTERAPEPLRAALKLVRLKEPLMDKQWRHHGGGRRGRWAEAEYEIPIECYAAIQEMLDVITPWTQIHKNRRTGRESTRWVYEGRVPGSDDVRRLVVGVDEDDGVPIVLSLHRTAKKAAPSDDDAAPTSLRRP